jgi:hypothetical protein
MALCQISRGRKVFNIINILINFGISLNPSEIVWGFDIAYSSSLCIYNSEKIYILNFGSITPFKVTNKAGG